jgi:ribonuclease BN (tRNA processing enzyme)
VNPDTDGDARIDGSDNCPNWSNASQALPNWTVPANDSDCDGWNKTREQHVGTDPTKHCNADKTFNNEPDAWPGDFNDNKLTNLADVVSFGPTFNKLPNDDGYNQRYDLNVNNITNLADIVTMGPFFNKLCG